MALRLKKGDITLREIIKLSKTVYEKEVDDKSKRADIDIVSGTLATRSNLKYDYKTKTWQQTARETKISFLVRSNPTSYLKQDTLKKHTYPVTFLFRDFNKGLDSPFRWRTGGFKKPLFAKKGSTKEERTDIANKNIKNQTQLAFFFELEHILSIYGLLWGPNRTNRQLPKVKNPKLIPYLDKTAYYCVTKVLIKILATKKGASINQKF